jgi:hypothetical protein
MKREQKTEKFMMNGLKPSQLLISFKLSKNQRGKEFTTTMFKNLSLDDMSAMETILLTNSQSATILWFMFSFI